MTEEKYEIWGNRANRQKIPKLYDICIELGIYGAGKDVDWNDREINRFTDAIKQHCEKRDLTLEIYTDILTYELKKRRGEIEENKEGDRYECEYDPCVDYDPHDVEDSEIDDGYYDNKSSEDET